MAIFKILLHLVIRSVPTSTYFLQFEINVSSCNVDNIPMFNLFYLHGNIMVVLVVFLQWMNMVFIARDLYKSFCRCMQNVQIIIFSVHFWKNDSRILRPRIRHKISWGYLYQTMPSLRLLRKNSIYTSLKYKNVCNIINNCS